MIESIFITIIVIYVMDKFERMESKIEDMHNELTSHGEKDYDEY